MGVDSRGRPAHSVREPGPVERRENLEWLSDVGVQGAGRHCVRRSGAFQLHPIISERSLHGRVSAQTIRSEVGSDMDPFGTHLPRDSGDLDRRLALVYNETATTE